MKKRFFWWTANRPPYTPERLNRMYSYLDDHGELVDNLWKPIGDVTFWPEDMPIVIGDPACRGRGIGRKVVRTLIERAKSLGFTHLEVGEIYDFNADSRRCFEATGFKATRRTEKGWHYEWNL